MKISVAILLTSVAMLAPLAATAIDPNLYLRLDSGYSFSQDMDKDIGSNDADSSAIVGLGVGYHFNEHIRADATVGYRGWYKVSAATTVLGATLSGDADINSTVGLINAYYDIGRFDRFTPYVGGGLGFARNHVGSTDLALGGVGVGNIDSNTNTDFAWQLSAGTAINIAHGVDLDIGYRYLDMGTAKTSDSATVGGTPLTGATLKGNLQASEIQAGLRIGF